MDLTAPRRPGGLLRRPQRPRAPLPSPPRRPARLRPPAASGSDLSPSLHVDWRLYNQHVLFIDRTDTLRAPLAVGLLGRVPTGT
jgi:hypothetical protein